MHRTRRLSSAGSGADGRRRCRGLAPGGIGIGLGGRRRIDVIGEVVDQAEDGLLDLHPAHMLQHPAIDVQLSQRQAAYGDLVVIFRQRLALEIELGLMGGLVRVVGEHALIEILLQRQGRLVAQDDGEKLQPLDMPAEDHEAEGQGRRQEQPDRAPQPGPEGGGDDDRNGREAGAMAVEQRLHDLAHEGLDDEEQAGRPDQHRPARIDRQGKGGGKDAAMTGPI